MRKYKIVNPYRLYEFLLGILILLVFIIIGLVKIKFGFIVDASTKIPVEGSTVNIDAVKAEYDKLQNKKINNVLTEAKQLQEVKKMEHKDLGEFTISFYDLSVQSCGKLPTHKAYGISRSGFDLRGHTYETARAIAVDPKVIPLGSKVFLQFKDDEYKFLTGVYTAYDTGNAIKNKKIDLFIGENETKYCMQLGLTRAKAILLK